MSIFSINSYFNNLIVLFSLRTNPTLNSPKKIVVPDPVIKQSPQPKGSGGMSDISFFTPSIGIGDKFSDENIYRLEGSVSASVSDLDKMSTFETEISAMRKLIKKLKEISIVEKKTIYKLENKIDFLENFIKKTYDDSF